MTDKMLVETPISTETVLTEDTLFKMGVLNICESVHMMNNHSSDIFTDFQVIQMKMYLNQRLRSWKDYDSEYDTAVKTLIEVLLREKEK